MENLLIVMFAKDLQTWSDSLLSLLSKYECLIEESRLISCANEIVHLSRISGNWDALAKLEDSLSHIKSEEGRLEVRRVAPLKLSGEYLPYVIQIVGLNKALYIKELVQFFILNESKITDLQADSFKNTTTDSKLLTLLMRLQIPAHIHIADLRERFMLLCEELNIDGILEPEKTVR